jgi:hypothetical protein
MASVAQAPRRLATKSPQVEPAATTAEDRRERKRASDRLAQREHRKRQREYIDELEAQLKLIKEGSHSESVAVLVAENERLKAEVRFLYVINHRSYRNANLDTVAATPPSICFFYQCRHVATSRQYRDKPPCLSCPFKSK